MANAGGDFTDILIQRKIICAEQIVQAHSLHEQSGTKLQDAVVALGFATAEEVVAAIAEFHNLPFVNLAELTIPASVVELVPESVARENVVLPLEQENGILKIILGDPTDLGTIQRLQFILNKEIQAVLAPREQIIEAIDRHYGQTETKSVDAMLAEFTDTDIDFTETDATQPGAAADDSDPRVVKLVDHIITAAISLRASDIHIEPLCDRVRLRYRIDGVLVERDSPSRQLLTPMLSRIKFMSNIDRPRRTQPEAGRLQRLLAPFFSRSKAVAKIDIPERPQPSDGHIKMTVADKILDLRVNIVPTQYGESAVIRIHDRISIKDLGLDQKDEQRFRQNFSRSGGLVLVTGPMGSGKTTTLYAALEQLNRPDRRIIAADDAVEWALNGIAQWLIHRDVTSANAVRSILAQAPDIVVVGVIRDHETAQIAVQASLSGRLVFSTLHTTNDASSAITRLVDFGVQPFLIASSVTTILAQRLVRVICPMCKQPDEPGEAEINAAGITPDQLAGATFMCGLGCNYCHLTGYRGRLGIFEMLDLNTALRETICNREPTQNIRRQARSLGMRTLMGDGVNKALRGMTTLEEVLRACHHELETDTDTGRGV